MSISLQWCIFVSECDDVMGNHCGQPLAPLTRGEHFLKHGPKLGLLAHFEQIVRCGGGHWISPLCFVLEFRHQSLIFKSSALIFGYNPRAEDRQ